MSELFIIFVLEIKNKHIRNANMIRKKSSGPMVIDLTGSQGNAYFLLGTAKNLAKQLELDPDPITQEMISGDYENLIRVFDRYFGEYIILER